MMFQKAERKRSKLRLALCGPSGSGKTYSALLIAQGLANGGKVAMLDTERGSGALYADVTGFDVAGLAPPFEPEKYIEGIRQAEKAGYEVLIIDSLSHAWAGEGGILDMHDKATASVRGGNSFTAWREVTPQHNALVDALLQSNLHLIVTMRTKTAYDMIDDGKGKKKPVKIGMAPVQRDGLEYEFTVVLDLSVDGHVATAGKDRTRLFDGKHFLPEVATGEKLRAWLDGGAMPAAPQPEMPTGMPPRSAADLRERAASFRQAADYADDPKARSRDLETAARLEAEAANPERPPPEPMPPPTDKPRISAENLAAQIKKATPLLESGARKPEQIISALQTKYFLSEWDKKAIREVIKNA